MKSECKTRRSSQDHGDRNRGIVADAANDAAATCPGEEVFVFFDQPR